MVAVRAMVGALIEVAVLLMHLAMWWAWELIATQPPSDRLIGAVPGLIAFVAIYATVDNFTHRGNTRWNRGPLITVVMVTAAVSALGGGRDGLARAAQRQATPPTRVATPEQFSAGLADHVAVERWAAPANLEVTASTTYRDNDGDDQRITCAAVPLVSPARVDALTRGQHRAVVVALVAPGSDDALRRQELAPIPRDSARPLYLRAVPAPAADDACGLALNALRVRGLVIEHPLVVRAVPAPREGPLPSRTRLPVRATLGVLVVLATALSRKAR